MILEKIELKLNEAIKASNRELSDIYRMVKSALINAKIAKPDHTLSETDEIEIIRKEIKKRQQSAVMFREGNRPELAEKEEREVTILSEFVPAEMDDAQIESIVAEAIKSTGATSASDMGKVMGAAMPQLKGKADGGKISEIVRRLLS